MLDGVDVNVVVKVVVVVVDVIVLVVVEVFVCVVVVVDDDVTVVVVVVVFVLVLVVVENVVVVVAVVVVVVSSNATPVKVSLPIFKLKSLFRTMSLTIFAKFAFFKVMMSLMLPRVACTPRNASLGRPVLATRVASVAAFTASRSAVSKSA